MLFEPNPTTYNIAKLWGFDQICLVSGKDLQCGRDPQMNTLIFAGTEWSLSTGRQLLFPESSPFPLRSTAISMRMPSMAFAVDHYVWRLHFLNTQLRHNSLCAVTRSRPRSPVFQPSLVAMEVGDRQLAHKSRASESCLGSNVMA